MGGIAAPEGVPAAADRAASASVAKRARTDGEAEDLYRDSAVKDLMKLYYGRLFPHELMFKWLSYGNDAKHPKADKSYFPRREFCFTLDGDVFVRYQSFTTCADMAAAIRQRCPSKIDIGPVYNVDPKKRAAYASGVGERSFRPLERELVFDIDMDDYDDVLNYSLKEHGWERCWPLMAAAIRVLDRALRDDFGFRHVFWVFSGRRGIHGWVCDARARQLTDEERSAIASYLSIYRGLEAGRAKLMLTTPRHPSVQRAAELLEPAWRHKLLHGQDVLASPSACEKILRYIPDDDLAHKLRERWRRDGSGNGSGDGAPSDVSVRRWDELVREVDRAASRTKDPAKRRALSKCKDEIVFGFAYPKLDVEVSKKRNHLLKAPFCVHPKTGKVSPTNRTRARHTSLESPLSNPAPAALIALYTTHDEYNRK